MATEREVYDALVRAGLSRTQASGVMGNFQNESSFNQEIVNPAGPASGVGLAQWQTTDYPAAAGYVTGNPSKDLQTQVQAILHAARGLNLTGTAQDVAGVWASQFEKCAGCQPGGAQYLARQQNALRIYNQAVTGKWPSTAGPGVQQSSGGSGGAGGTQQATLTAAQGSGILGSAGSLLHGLAVILDRAFAMFAPGQGWRMVFGAASVVLLLLSYRSFSGGVPGLMAWTSTAGSGPTGSAFVSEAGKAIGTPYVWGGAHPGGFDCSGLVQYSAEKVGIHNVPRTSEEQWAWVQRISQSQLQPGDLVFEQWPGEASPGHVAIYAGGGQIIQAPAPGQNVQKVKWSPGIVHQEGGSIVGYGRIPGMSYGGQTATLTAAQGGSGGGPNVQQATLTAALGGNVLGSAGSLLHGAAVVLDRIFGLFGPGQGWRLVFGAASVVLLLMSYRSFSGGVSVA